MPNRISRNKVSVFTFWNLSIYTTVGFLWTPVEISGLLSTLENVVAGYGCIGYVRIADLVFTTAVQFTADQTAGLTTGKKRNFQLFQPVVMSACVECHAGTREV
jgi:hypothetical protein